MDFLAHARRRAFSFWLRTGRLPHWVRGGSTERKFNPWHDPDDGRFTFKGTGRYFGRGSSGRSDARMHERPREPRPNLALNGGGASGAMPPPVPPPPAGQPAPLPGAAPGYSRARVSANHARGWSRTVRSSYTWWLDASGRLREVEGTLKLVKNPRRSHAAQRQAGGPDRRPSDEGGHYIAPRFDGPADAFNHFAQDRNFNRGTYRLLEDQWARALRAGKRVDVRIMPVYQGSSGRPSSINVWFWIDGRPESQKFQNEYRGGRNVGR